MPRDVMISAIDLAKVTGSKPSDDLSQDMLIITNFNQMNIAFHVHRVLGIHRVSWTEIITPDTTVSSTDHGIATGIVKINGNLIVILDFERIVTNISPETGLKVHEIEQYASRERNNIPIYIAEDSAMLRAMIEDSLKKAGYENLNSSKNGQECWEKLQKLAQQHPDDIDQYVRMVITDIEMPLMDGHRLTKLVKESPVLKAVPVAIFSSLISPEMRKKGEQLGATIQMSKPEIGLLVGELDKVLLK